MKILVEKLNVVFCNTEKTILTVCQLWLCPYFGARYSMVFTLPEKVNQLECPGGRHNLQMTKLSD